MNISENHLDSKHTSGLCTKCGKWIKVKKSDFQCPKCGAVILKHVNYDLYKKLFACILQEYGDDMKKLESDEPSIHTIPIVMRGACYFVPISTILHYGEISKNSNEKSKHRLFFHEIMGKCKRVQL